MQESDKKKNKKAKYEALHLCVSGQCEALALFTVPSAGESEKAGSHLNHKLCLDMSSLFLSYIFSSPSNTHESSSRRSLLVLS